LITQQGLQAEEADLLAAITMGSLGAAVNIDKKDILEKRQRWLTLLRSVRAYDYRAAMDAAEALANNKDELLEFLEWAFCWHRDRLVYTVTRSPQEIVNLDLLSEIQGQSVPSHLENILSLLSETAGAVERIQRNLNRRMVLEQLLLHTAGSH